MTPSLLIDQWSGYLFTVLVVLLCVQQWRLYKLRKYLAKREELFRIVTQNAADMIALVDVKGRRLYNSPAYEHVLGYTPEELAKTSAFEQIHPEDRMKVLEASREAKRTGVGEKLEYRIRHKNGSWRILESTASPIRGKHGAVEALVIVNRDITARKIAEEALEHNSFHDVLTTLPNRRLFLDRLQRSFVRAQRNPNYRYAVLFVDVDRFKALNETIGTAAADIVIKEIAQRLSNCLRGDDTVARPKGKMPTEDMLSHMGGDEFTILLEGLGDPSDAMRVAQRIQAAVAKPIAAENREVLATISIGIALNGAAHEQPEDLLRHADTAMRRAKARGGSHCEVFDEAMHQRALKRLKLEAELQAALNANQFQLWYQPIVHLGTRQIRGFEALLRWKHPQQGLVSPYGFLEVAENTGLLVSIGEWVIREACRQLAAWRAGRSSLDALTMTVNISPRQLAYPHFVRDTEAAMRSNGIAPGGLLLEMAESAAMSDPRLVADVLVQLKRVGVCISMGDFGAGLSSPNWLRRLSLDELKIDRSLVASLATDRANADIVHLIVSVARSLELRVVAEGVENVVQLQLLRDLGCELGQGHLFSHPIDAQQAEQLLRGSLGAGAKG